jgi:hypothetical protein
MLDVPTGSARAQAVSFSQQRPGFAPGSVHLGFMVEKEALGKVFLRVLRFHLSVLFLHGSPCSRIIWGMKNKPVGGRSSEISSHPMDVNICA